MLIPPSSRARHPLLVRALLLGLVVAVLLGGLLAYVRPAGAQGAPTRAFTMLYLVGEDTIGVERVEASAAGWTGDLRITLQGRMRWTQRLGEPDGQSTLVVDAWRPGAADNDAPMQRMTLQVRGDSAYVYPTPPDGTALGTPVATLPARHGAAWLINQSLVHSAWLAQRAVVQRRDSLHLMLASGARLVSGAVSRDGNVVTFTLLGQQGTFRFTDQGAPESVDMPAQRLRGVVVRGEAAAAVRAPVEAAVSYAAPADAPYLAEDVTVATPMGHTLAATLTRPRAVTGRVPVVITISGSGGQERDEAIPGVQGYRPFRQIADTLGRHGIAVLRFDDRGIGGSGGDHATATSRDFAEDVRALVAWARAHPALDPSRVILLGHSEGGLIAPLVAADDPTLAGIALLAGPAYAGARIIAFQQRSAIAQQHPTAFAAQRDSLFRTAQAELERTARDAPWLREFLAYDPLPTAARVRVPVLVLQGDTDLQVTPEQADTLAATLRAAGNPRVTLRRLPRTNHLFQRDANGTPSGYGALIDRRMTSESLAHVVDWVREVTAR
ncbi:MAG TPA: alpha/beta fold hydrolase [Gemmatimonadaceae bacterium]|nr:alpha/beta fold hydrolase [Gemmatimonadaceae bacterium]